MAAKRMKKLPKKTSPGPVPVVIKPRNPFAPAVVRRKSGAHQKSQQALRKHDKDRLVHTLRKLGVKGEN